MIINRRLITLYLPSILLVGALLTSCNKSDTPAPTSPSSTTGTTGGGTTDPGTGGGSGGGTTDPGTGGGSGGGTTDPGTGGGSGGGTTDPGTGGGSGGGTGGSGTGGGTANISADEQKMLDLVNKVRATGCNCGGEQMPAVAAVTWNAQLKTAAQGHSDWMLANNTMSHTGANGSNPGDRITAAGYAWRTYGENVAMGFSSVDAVMQGWLGSPGHCKNIMNGSFKEFGSGVAGKYWTQNFGTKK